MNTHLIKRPHTFLGERTGFTGVSPNRKTTRPFALKSTLSAALSLLMGLSAFGQGYEPNDITPIGSSSGKLSGASRGKQVGGVQATTYYTHAVRQHDNALTAEDIHPTNFYYSMATCSDDSQEGGWGYSFLGGVHALVWTGASCIDLNPSGYNFSYCLGVHGGKQVGYAQNQTYFITGSHAMCWHGSATTVVDLHPPNWLYYSRATACSDADEVGYIASLAYPEGESISYHTTSHAYRWQGSAASAVDLHPAGYDASEATATNGTQQGGWGYIALGASHLHALLWSGDATSVSDLHSAAYTETRINAMSTTKQVGEGWVGAPGAVGSVRHALAWSGTADTVEDLNKYVPAGYPHAVATGVDEDGNIVGYAYKIFAAGVSIPAGAISVVFAPGQTAPGDLASLSLSATNVAPGAVVPGVVKLGGPAPAGGTNISFVSSQPTLAAAPAAIVIPEGDSQATFDLPTGGATLTVPTDFKVYATDGLVSQCAQLTLTPVVKASSFTANPVEGGFTTYASISVNIPAQVGGATFTLASGNPSLAAVPASVTVPQGYMSWSFSINTSPVSVATDVPITATFNGQTITGTLTLSPAPVVALASINVPAMVGGQSVTGSVTVNNFPRNAGGAAISLSSGNGGALQVPATVTIPQGAVSVTFPVTTSVVNGITGVSVKATYNGGNLSTTVAVNPVPTVTITSASYDPVTQLFKVQADTSFANSILTFGTTAAGGPIGTMQFELGVWKGSTLMTTAPTTATVWNSNGGQASMPVTIKGVASGGGGGGGGGTTTTGGSYKLSTSKTGKGTITVSPAAATYAAGTVVTLTATPDAGSPWLGWSGSIFGNFAVGMSKTITVTMNANVSLTANFK